MILRKNKHTLFFLLMLTIASCMKEEIPVAPHQPGEANINQVEMKEDYRNQIYFSLATNSVVSSNVKTDWDLAFESNGAHIILNTAKGMAVHQSTLNFDELTSTDDVNWRWDANSGNLDTTAIGNWTADNYTYLIDRGYNWTGDHQGYAKIRLETVTPDIYLFTYGDLEATEGTSYTLNKSTIAQFTYFSFDNQEVAIAPADATYDLIFTQYTHLFKDPVTPYVVTGVLLNRSFTHVTQLEGIAFEQIVREDVKLLNYQSAIDAIGYDWKNYSLEEGIFTVDASRNYIIKTQTGLFYKFRFNGFYNTEGLKGYPSFEFQAL